MALEARDAPVGGQAVLEGVMMRGVVHVGGRRPQAADGEIDRASRYPRRLVELEAAAPRRCAGPSIRGVVALGESLAIGFKALEHLRQRAAARGRGADLRRARGRCTIVVALALAVGLFFVVPVGADQPVQGRSSARRCCSGSSRAILRTAIFLGYLVAALAPARPAPRVRVPRRRAQDDLLLRGGPAADARERAALLAPAPALRHELPARS